MYSGLWVTELFITTTILVFATEFTSCSNESCSFLCSGKYNSRGVLKLAKKCDDDHEDIINGTKPCPGNGLLKSTLNSKQIDFSCCPLSTTTAQSRQMSTSIQINPISSITMEISPSSTSLASSVSDDNEKDDDDDDDDEDDNTLTSTILPSSERPLTTSSGIPINPGTTTMITSTMQTPSDQNTSSKHTSTSLAPSPSYTSKTTSISSTTIPVVSTSETAVSSSTITTSTVSPKIMESSIYPTVETPSSTFDKTTSVTVVNSSSIISKSSSENKRQPTSTSMSSVTPNVTTTTLLSTTSVSSSTPSANSSTPKSSHSQTSVLTSTPSMTSSPMTSSNQPSSSSVTTSSSKSETVTTPSVKPTELPVFCLLDVTGKILHKGRVTWNAIKVHKNVSTMVNQPCPYGPAGAMAVRLCKVVNNVGKWGEVNMERCRPIPSCSPIITGNKLWQGVMHWPEAHVTTKVELPCPYSRVSGKVAYRWCRINDRDFSAFWDKVYDEECRTLDVNNTKMGDLNTIAITEKTEVEVAVLMNAITLRSDLSVGDVSEAADIFEDLVKEAQDLNAISEELLDMVSNLMAQNSTTLAGANENTGATREILRSLMTMLENLELEDGESLRVDTVNLISEIQELANVTDDLVFPSVSGQDRRKRDVKARASIRLPRSILKAKQRVTFFNFMNDKLFAMRSVTKNTFINSDVISASIMGTEVKNLTDGHVVIEFAIHDPTYTNNCSCAYWDFKADNGYGNWSTDGCVFEIINSERARCLCNHLTHFALLVDLFPEVKISKADHLILQAITFTGCYLSIFGLVLTIIALLSFKKFRKNISGKILLNLCFAMLLFLLVFVSGIDKVESESTCVAVGAMLHYFVLVAIIWMGAEAFHLFLNVVFLPGELGTAFVVKCAVVAWVLPLIIVLITVLVKTDDYVGREYCRVHGNSFYIAFMVPTLAIMLCNFIIFIIVLKVLVSTSFPTNRQSKPHLHFRRVFSIMTIFGLTWIFGVLAVGDLRVPFQYLFCIFNTLQGFMIFFIYILSDRSVRENLVRCICCLPAQPSNRVLTSTQLQSDIEIDMRDFEPRVSEGRTQAWVTSSEMGHPYVYPVPPYPVSPGSKPVTNIAMLDEDVENDIGRSMFVHDNNGASSLRTSAVASVTFINQGRVVHPPVSSMPLEEVARTDPFQERRERNRKRVKVREPTVEELQKSDEQRRLSELPEWLPRLRNFNQVPQEAGRPQDSSVIIDRSYFEPRLVNRNLPVAEDDLEHQYFDQLNTTMGPDEIVDNFLSASKSTNERSGQTITRPLKHGSESDSSSVASDHRLSELPSCLPTPKTQSTLPGQSDERQHKQHTHFEVV